MCIKRFAIIYLLYILSIYTPNLQNMVTIKKINDSKYIIDNNNIIIRSAFINWKLWLTKKEISDIYAAKKSYIKNELNNVIENSNLCAESNIKKIYNSKRDKNETFYSLDVLLLLWYNIKHFKETKILVQTNNLLKEYTDKRKPQFIWTIFSEKIKQFSLKSCLIK